MSLSIRQPPLPPGPSTSVETQTFQWFARPYDFLREGAARYGEPFTAHFSGFGPHVFFSHPEAIRTIFTTNSAVLVASEANALMRPFMGAHSLFLLDGERHLRQRRLLLPAFHGQRLHLYGTHIRDIAASASATWGEGKPFAVHASLLEISLRIILRVIFGFDENLRSLPIAEPLSSLLKLISTGSSFTATAQDSTGRWDPRAQLQAYRQHLSEVLKHEFSRRRQCPDVEAVDVLSLLLTARDEQGHPLTDEELCDQLMTLLIAGHETTATALSWALYWLHTTPHVHDRLLREIDESRVFADPNVVTKLEYLQAVCQETLRISPIVPIAARFLRQPIQIRDVSLEAGTYVVACIYLTHHREDLYPDSGVFRPERFLRRRFSSYEYLPFGGGVHQCLGAAFALYEMKIILATLLAQFSFTPAHQRPIHSVRRSVTVAPSEGGRMVVTRRKFIS